MSREHKFRAWDVKNKRMFEPRGYEYTPSGGWWIISENVYNDDGSFGKLLYIDTLNASNPESCILIEFTGLKDKNGKENYHKDISVDEDGDKYLTEWNDEKARYYLKGAGIGCLGMQINDLDITAIKQQKVIGNQLENPELLEVK